MKRILYYLFLTLLFGGGLFYYYRVEYPKLPLEVKRLNNRIQAKNEKLISAQILAQELDLVARLIDRNLAISNRDSLAQDASLPFLEYITGLLDKHKIMLITLEPSRHRVTQHDYVKTMYNMTIECNYKRFGKFINDLEKSDRLITVESFEIKNQLGNVEGQKKQRRAVDSHLFELTVSTLTLIKHT